MTLRRFAWVSLGYNLLVIVWGGYVRASGSGAGCGRHWPLCNGVAIPRDPGVETIIELTHRVTSGLALVLVAILAAWVFRTHPPGHRLRRAAAAAAVFILLEAAVGAGLVLLELVGDDDSVLRAGYLAIHLANTFLLLASLAVVALWADRPEPAGPRRPVWNDRGGLAILGAILAVGATGAVTALGDTLFPAGSLREGLIQDTSPTAHVLIRLRVIHPALAVLTAIAVIVYAVRTMAAEPGPRVHRAGWWLVGLTAGQLAMGTVNLLLLVPIATQLLHLAMADLVWTAAVVLMVEKRERGPGNGERGAASGAAARIP